MLGHELIPSPQGRAAERILFQALEVGGKLMLSNSFFDTTRWYMWLPQEGKAWFRDSPSPTARAS